jgi:D-glycero-D-manno-heptose 1,7-bisphosphate phosphatase
MSPERRAVFFDRDGTLMEEEDYCKDPARVRAIPRAGEALASLRREGWLNVIITNQSGIGRGYFTMADYERVNAELFRQLGKTIDASYCCPDHPDQPSARRKPGTGMIEEAVADHNIDTSKSWMIGDKNIDVQAGRDAGCRTILVLTGYGEKHQQAGADFIARDVVEAVEIILKNS